MPLWEYYGCMRYHSDMREDEIRDEITRLLRRKQCDTHHLDLQQLLQAEVKQVDYFLPKW